jgi:type IV secretory pathway TraG/TraD family ATPase VirD4
MDDDTTRDAALDADIAPLGYNGLFAAAPFGIRDSDRTNHLYLIGKTGTGKSTLLENLMVRDIAHGHGFAFLDPHGTHAQAILDHIPPERLDDVLYFNIADREYPIGFNPLADVPPDDRPLVTDALVSSFRHIWQHVWGEGRMEQLLYNTIAALLDTEDATLLGVRRLLISEEYRRHMISQVRDPEVRAYWLEDFGTWAARYRREAIAPVLNKICQLFTSPLTRNILGQRTSALDIPTIMDDRRILIVNLAKGAVGHRTAKLLGSFLLSQFHLAAMRRDPATVPPAFHLYIDEFTTFATDAFGEMLSECRKHGLALTLAHQYIEQMSAETRAAVFGNVGTLAAFRVGQRDAEVLEKELSHAITAQTLVAQDNHHICIRLLDQGMSGEPFQAVTLPQPTPAHWHAQEVIDISRRHYGSPREEVERAIYAQWYPSFTLSFDA